MRLNKEMPGHVANRLQAALSARGLLPRRRGRAERRRRRHRPVLGPGPALGHHGQHDAQPSRRRSGRHRALLPAVRRPDDGLVEDPRLAGADAGGAKEAHRQRPCRGRIAHHRGAGGGARRSSARPDRAAQESCQAEPDEIAGAVARPAPPARSITVQTVLQFSGFRAAARRYPNAHRNPSKQDRRAEAGARTQWRLLSAGRPSHPRREGARQEGADLHGDQGPAGHQQVLVR